MTKDRNILEKELKELEITYKHLVEANIKLQDERNWAIEDKNRYEHKIKIALELLDNKASREEIKKALEKDYFEGD